MLVRDVMVKDVVTVGQDATLKDCVNVFFKKQIGSVVVVGEGGRIAGLFTEHDLVRALSQDIPLSERVSGVMTTNVVTISLDSFFGEAKELMRRYRIRHIPVVDDEERLVGLFSLTHIIDEFFEVIPRTRE